MFIQRKSVTITTDADGDATDYISVDHGRILSIHYAKTDFADGVDFTITSEATGEGLWTESNVNAAKSVYPRVPVTDQVGGGVTYDGTNEIYEPIAMAGDRVEIVIAQGGDTKSGTFTVLIG